MIRDIFLAGVKSISTSELADFHNNFDKYGSLTRKNVGNDDGSELNIYDSGGASWVSACINQKINDISNVEYYFIDNKTKKRIDDKNVPEEIKLPIAKGYADMSIGEMLGIAGGREDLCGNDLWVKIIPDNMYGQIYGYADSFMIVEGSCWQMRKKTGEYGIEEYIVNINGIQKIYKPDQVIHFRRSNIIDPYCGIGLIAQHRLTVENDAVSAEYQNAFYEKDGSPNMVIVDKGENNPIIAKQKGKQFRDNYRAGVYEKSIMYLYGNVDAKSVTLSASDMDYVNNKIANKQTTISIMESSPSVLGDEKSSGNRAIAITATNNYYKKVNSRIMHLVNVINRQHVWKVDPKRQYSLTFSPYSVGDIADVSIKLNSGIMTRDEARIELGYEPTGLLPMQTHFVNAGTVPINQAFEGMTINDSSKKKIY